MTFHPNWRATVDDVAQPVRPGTDGFIRIDVTPGHHVITMHYRPGSAKFALLAGGILIAIVSAFVERRRYAAVP